MASPSKSEIYYCKNPYFMGHEQGEHSQSSQTRPYLCIYSGNSYIIGFAMTTKTKKDKKGQQHKSHKNIPIITNNFVPGEIMLDQLHIIRNEDISNYHSDINKRDYNDVIKNFVQQIVNDDILEYSDGINFGTIISFKHNNPILSKFSDYIVISSNKFGKSGICLCFPKITTNGMCYLHSIDFNARQYSVVEKVEYSKEKIKKLQIDLEKLFQI